MNVTKELKIIKGASNTLVFTFEGASVDSFKDFYVYVRDAFHSVKKSGDDIVRDGNKIRVTLSQEECIKFDNRFVKVQLRPITNNGTPLATSIANVPVQEVLEEEVIPYE